MSNGGPSAAAGGASRRVMERLAGRIERVGEHDMWTGKVDRHGVPVTKHEGRSTTVRRLVWELAHGPLDEGQRVRGCSEHAACVRVEHLASVGGRLAAAAERPRRSAGSLRQTGPDSWELSVTAGRFDDGSVRRMFRTVRASSERAAARALAEFVAEVQSAALPNRKEDRQVTVDEAVEQFLTEHLLQEKFESRRR